MRRFPGLLHAASILATAAACHRKPAVTPTPAPVTPTPKPSPTIATGEALVRAMRDRYAGKWYRTMAFTQRTTLALPSGGEIVQTWYAAALLPGRLRIDSDLKSKTGTLFSHDTVYTFANGRLARADPDINESLLLAFDVYAQSASRTISELRRRGFDLDVLHDGTWQGKPVYVVGAARGDTMSRQFWVDRDRLLLLRLVERAPQGRSDVRLGQYVETGGGWIAMERAQYMNGKRRLLEEYSDVRTNVSLSEALFDARLWASAPHWRTAAPKD